jgi:hypothetical protein
MYVARIERWLCARGHFVVLLQIADFAVKRFRLKDAVDRVWVGPNFPRVFDVHEFMSDVKREMDVTGRDAMLDTMMRRVHSRLLKDFGIPVDKGVDDSESAGAAYATTKPRIGKDTSAVHRAAVYALKNGMVHP